MNIALWVVAGLLALAFLAAGFGKVSTPRAALKVKGMAYVDDFADWHIKAIGVAEILGAIGLIVPAFMGSLSWLVAAAAVGLTVTMAGGVIVHARRKEPFIPALVLGVLAAFVAVGRISLAPF